jgi:predicted nucleic acid-binding protein
MRGEPHPAVLAWMAAQPRTLLYTTHINQAEILDGITALPEGRRRTALAATANGNVRRGFSWPYSAVRRRSGGALPLGRARTSAGGNPIEKFDALIAASALAAGASIATRDFGGFTGCGLAIVNPWEVT